MTKMKDAKVISKELLVNSFKKVVNEKIQFADDDVQDWIYIDSPKSVMVIALTPENDLVLVKLYRHNLKSDYFELPAGGAEHENETTLEAAKRELLEETGYSSDKIIDLGKFYVLPSETNRWIHYYLVKDSIKIQEPQKDDLIEKYFDMSVELIPFDSLQTTKAAANVGIEGVETLYGITLAREYLAE